MNTTLSKQNIEHTTFKQWAEVIAQTIEQLGVKSDLVFKNSGISDDFWRDSGARIPVKLMQKVWRESVKQTGESAFGLYVAENLSPYDFQSLGILLLSSSSIANMFEKLATYRSFINNGVGEGKVIIKGETTIINLTFSAQQKALVADESLDAFLAFLIKLCRILTNNKFSPLQIFFMREKPENYALYESYFNCPIKYNKKWCKFI